MQRDRVYSWSCIVDNIVNTSFLSFLILAYLMRWLFVSALSVHKYFVLSTKQELNICRLLEISSGMKTFLFLYQDIDAKSAFPAASTDFCDTCTKIIVADSTFIRDFFTRVAFVKWICVEGTWFRHIDIESANARVAKDIDFGDFWVSSFCTRGLLPLTLEILVLK